MSPNTGPASGGTNVIITGTGFIGAAAVQFGNTAATNFTVNSATQITATAPAGSLGSVDVTVVTVGGPSATSDSDDFTNTVSLPTVTAVSLNVGSTSGGTSVTITGTSFIGVEAVDFGATAATNVTVVNDTQITCTSPAGTAGPVNVIVTTALGASATSSSDEFNYDVVPGGFLVTNTSNNPATSGSLPWAVAQANADTSNAEITFDSSIFTSATTITPASTLTLSNTGCSITINGSNLITIAGSGSNVFQVNTGVTAALAGLHFQGLNGSIGILDEGFLSLSSSIVSQNTTDLLVDSGATLTATDSTITTAQTGIANYGQILLSSCTLASDSEAVVNNNLATIESCTLSGNDSSGPGVVYNANAAIITFTNCTMEGNVTDESGTIYNATGGTVTVCNSTIYGNLDNEYAGGGLYNTGTLELFNTIVAGNTLGGSPSDVGGTVTGSFNFIGTGASGFTNGVNGNQVGTVASPLNPQLTALGNYGGSTETMLLENGGSTLGAGGAITQINAAITAATTSIPVANAAVFAAATLPTLSSGFYYTIQIDAEQMQVVGVTVNSNGTGTLTVVRTANSTMGATHASNASVFLVSDQRGDLASYASSAVVNIRAYQGPGVAGTVADLSPNTGPAAGGTSVILTGTGFLGTTAVQFGGTAATSFTVNSATQITATAPAGTGVVDVTVTSATGNSAISNTDQFTYAAAPTVTGVSPNTGPASGGTNVIITGTGFIGAAAVQFGNTAATNFTVNSATQITATAPAGTGVVDVTVTIPVGVTSATSSADQFTYVAAPTVTDVSPNTGTGAGGISVIIAGTGFIGATAVQFGGTAATSFTVNSATQITATAPAGSVGTVGVTVITVGGTSAASSGDDFTYTISPPTVAALSPNYGSASGGTSVTISGTNFINVEVVDFGATAATNVTVVSSTQITCTSPAGTVGPANVTVTTASGISTTASSDEFTYVSPGGFIVTNTSNSATVSGSLPWAVAQADTATSNATITFDAADFPTATTITLAGMLTLSNTAHSITIDGSGAGPIIISGNYLNQIMMVNSGVNAILTKLNLVDASSSTGALSNVGTLTINDCSISGTVAGHAFYNDATLTVNDSVISGNSGGGIFNNGSIVVFDTTMSGNSVGGNGGAVFSDGTAIFIGDTISGNHANGGAGLEISGGTMTIADSTVYDNTITSTTSPVFGGGIYASNGVVNIINSTVAGNSCSSSSNPSGAYGGGIFVETATVNLLNAIVSNNSASGSGPDLSRVGGPIFINQSLIGNTDGSGIISTSGTGNILNP